MAAAAGTAAGQPGSPVSLNSLNLQQLVGVKDQLDGEVQNLAAHLRTLRMASGRLQEARDALGKFADASDEAEDQQAEVLVPLTSSVYVKGRLVTRKKLLVDVGTGYLVEKNCEDAKKGLEKNVSMVNEQVTKLEKILPEKQRQAEAAQNMIQQKYFQQQLMLQQQMQGGAQPASK
ncbi:prefoldin, alpha subunit protein [Besnoitia besnoiti]|uniref:Prefoldin, alpha subunit protein n=1 Tax=Besnoitia besnoiti TaxID=94643 RepID=A0A2A9MKI0_BESBE|nr:prefoldin, alpha subunit protein [Besnoitia besnoiti]PFH35940.1 prefoldin, alpha subunit protein [Besnoitia besnoiti]